MHRLRSPAYTSLTARMRVLSYVRTLKWNASKAKSRTVLCHCQSECAIATVHNANNNDDDDDYYYDY